MWVNIKMHLMVLPNCVYQGRRHGLQVESHSPLRHCFVFSLSHCVLIKVADHDVPVLEQIQKGANTRGGGGQPDAFYPLMFTDPVRAKKEWFCHFNWSSDLPRNQKKAPPPKLPKMRKIICQQSFATKILQQGLAYLGAEH